MNSRVGKEGTDLDLGDGANGNGNGNGAYHEQPTTPLVGEHGAEEHGNGKEKEKKHSRFSIRKKSFGMLN